jgi:RNA polymerase sigma-70 factor, ECF subfamily
MLVEHRQVVEVVTEAHRAVDVVAAYDANERDLFSFTLAVTRDRAAAEDLVQEAFLRLVREAHAGRWPENVRAWLYRVVVNLARSRARRRLVADRLRSLFVNRDVARSPEDDLIRRERGAALERALATLTNEARMAFLLASNGYSGQEVAALIGRSEGATRTLLWRARRELRRHMESEAAE